VEVRRGNDVGWMRSSATTSCARACERERARGCICRCEEEMT